MKGSHTMENFKDNYWKNQKQEEPTCGMWVRGKQGQEKELVIFTVCPSALFEFNCPHA